MATGTFVNKISPEEMEIYSIMEGNYEYPRIDELEEMLNKMVKCDGRFIHKVDVTYVADPHNFFIRPEAAAPLIREAAKMGRNYEKTLPALHSVVIFRSNTEHGYIRGTVLAVCPGEVPTCDIKAIDYGFLDKDVPTAFIFEPYYNNKQPPPMAILCQLVNCETKRNEEFSKEAIDAMRRLTKLRDWYKVVIVGRESGKLLVELYNGESKDIASLLAFTGFTFLDYINFEIFKDM